MWELLVPEKKASWCPGIAKLSQWDEEICPVKINISIMFSVYCNGSMQFLRVPGGRKATFLAILLYVHNNAYMQS